MNLASTYTNRYDTVLVKLAEDIERYLSTLLQAQPRVDRISARPKSVSRFLKKSEVRNENGEKKYSDPLNEIQDQVGARIITFYLSDVERIAEYVERYFHHIEARVHVPESQWEFGYFGKHYLLLFPTDAIDPSIDKAQMPTAFELQIKTLFQHAWSEANHDLGYKPGKLPLTSEQNRKLAFASAQAWGADQIFQSLFEVRELDEG